MSELLHHKQTQDTMISYIASLFLMSNVLLLVQSACTEGFMDLSLLERKAADPSAYSSLTTLAEEDKATRWIITDANNTFTCNNGRITGFLIGVDIRTVITPHPPSMKRDKYPSIEVWYKNSEGSQYKRNCSVMIELSPDNFTTNGIYHYVLSEPIYASSGYMLGVYQPKDSESVVRFYEARANRSTTVGRIKNGKINDNPIKVSNDINEDNDHYVIMIHPITGQCTIIMPVNLFNFLQIRVTAASIKFSLRMK